MFLKLFFRGKFVITEIVNGNEVTSDGKTVWVNAPSGECVSRFGKYGVDVHRTIADQEAGLVECLACTHGPVTMADWKLFQEATVKFYGVEVSDKHLPKYLKATFDE